MADISICPLIIHDYPFAVAYRLGLPACASRKGCLWNGALGEGEKS